MWLIRERYLQMLGEELSYHAAKDVVILCVELDKIPMYRKLLFSNRAQARKCILEGRRLKAW